MFGKRLRALREGRGLTQLELGRIIKLSPSTIGMYESGRRDPDSETLRTLAEYFGVTVDYLLGRTDDPMPPAGRRVTDEPVNPLQKRLVELGVYLRTNKELTEEDIKEIEDFIEYRRQKRMQLKRSKGDNTK